MTDLTLPALGALTYLALNPGPQPGRDYRIDGRRTSHAARRAFSLLAVKGYAEATGSWPEARYAVTEAGMRVVIDLISP